MRGHEQTRNLINIEVGDVLLVQQLNKNSIKQLTVNNKYTIIALKIDEDRPHRNEFCIITDTGNKKWYKHKNMMFKLYKKNGQYNSEQKYLLEEYTRQFISIYDGYNIMKQNNEQEAESIYNQDKESIIDDYLFRINKAAN